MSGLDMFTTTIVTAVVVIAAALVFLLETVVRRDSGSGRYWAAGFVAAILVTVCYVAWAIDRDLWLGVAVGNAAFVAQMGLMWLGCRVFNGRLGVAHRAAVALAALLALAAAIVQRDLGDWAGAPVMFAGIGLFAALAAVETRRGALRRVFATWGLTLALGAAALFYAGRLGVFLVLGPDSAVFSEWFGTNATSFVIIALTIVVVVSTSVLRVASATSPPAPGAPTSGRRRPALLTREILMAALDDIAGRSERAGAPLAIVAIRLEGLGEIAAAFGPSTAELIESSWHDAVHRHLPIGSPAGAFDDVTVGLALHPADADGAAAVGSDLRQGLIDELTALPDAVLPAIGVGFALAEDLGYDAEQLALAAQEAAARSAARSGMPVVRAGD